MAGRGQLIGRNGRWLARVYLGRDAGGKRRTAAKTFALKTDARRWLAKTLTEADTGAFVRPSDQPVAAYLREWLSTWAAPKVRPATLRQYEEMLERYAIPTLGDKRLSAVLPDDLQRLYNDLTARGLSPRTVRYLHTVLKQALRKAVSIRRLIGNPADQAEPPRQAQREMEVLDAQQAGRLLAAAEGTRFGPLWILLLTTGMRPSEALGLKWSDLGGSSLTVKRSLTRPRMGGGWELAEPKTSKSTRSVGLPSIAVAALQRQRAQQAADRLKAGPAWLDQGMVFTGEAGTPLDLRNLRRHFAALCRTAEVPLVRVYTLRHTAITLLLAAGENVKAVASSVGHANPTMTLNVYAHALPDAGAKLAATMDRVLAGGP